jgi:hypothetical protein
VFQNAVELELLKLEKEHTVTLDRLEDDTRLVCDARGWGCQGPRDVFGRGIYMEYRIFSEFSE